MAASLKLLLICSSALNSETADRDGKKQARFNAHTH